MPEFLYDLHGHVCGVDGVPIFETDIMAPNQYLVVRVPIPRQGGYRKKLVVGDAEAFLHELWMETALNQAVESEMGDVLEWLYGERKITSNLNSLVQSLRHEYHPGSPSSARTIASGLRTVGGRSMRTLPRRRTGSGSTGTRSV